MASIAERVARRYLRRNGFVSREINTSVAKIHVLEAPGQGSLPPVVLLHGFGASGVQMLPLLVRLKRHVSKLVVPDMPAHGFSEVPTDGAHPDALKAGLFETLDAVIDGPVVLFGNSMGGFAAIQYAVAHPGKVSHLVLCSPGGAAMDQLALDDFRKVFFIDSHAEALDFTDRLLGKRSKLRHLLALSVRRRMGQPALRELMGAVTPEHLLLPEHLEALEMPTLVVWGQGDRILPDAHRSFFRAHLPGHAELVEPERLGHSPYLESPGHLTRHIVDFLAAASA
ncbi:MAG: alpha/beta hydrolase [Deltaproteobacteria bacterium]|nr:alpha/beta hydrolase [Deltaproteobacteria bacterium]